MQRHLSPKRRRGSRWIARLVASTAFVSVTAVAAGPARTISGSTVGGAELRNPVWEEAKDPARHRYTFREPSPTVRADVLARAAFLPKELCVTALVDGDGKAHQFPLRVVVAGGRTSPVTLVIAPTQRILFENQDPFPHALYVVGADSMGLAPAETGPAKSRAWTPPGPGKYEIRDKLAPSVRSWIVVDTHAVNVGYPDRKGNFSIELEPGAYKVRGWFGGEPVGVELPITVASGGAEQSLKAPLVVGREGG
jgi:hypothetical protein